MNTSHPFREWRRQRPLVGSVLLLLAGVEMFFSTQLDLGNMHIQLGIEGFQATVIPLAFVLLAVLITAMPQHRIFYGVIALALSIYSIVGVNLGGFLIGMLLSAVGGILAVSWAPRAAQAEGDEGGEVLGNEAPRNAGWLQRTGSGTGSGETVGDAASPEPVAAGHVAAGQVAAGHVAAGHDGAVHAEFVPYPALVARARSTADDTHAAPPPFSGAPAEAGAKRSGQRQAPASSRGKRAGAATAAAVLFVTALVGLGNVGVPSAQAEPAALCLPILMTCPAPTPTPSPSSGWGSGSGSGSGSSSGGGLGGIVGGLLGGVTGGGGSTRSGKGSTGSTTGPLAPLVIGPDTGAYPMTLPAGQLGGSSIAISGIHQVGLVSVKKVDGSSFTVIKLVADDIVITGFLLDVRRATGPSLVSTADRMELHGNVNVWLDSLTGTTLGGLGLTLGTDQTPPPGNELPSSLLRVNLGLVATSAGSITYTNLHQELHG